MRRGALVLAFAMAAGLRVGLAAFARGWAPTGTMRQVLDLGAMTVMTLELSPICSRIHSCLHSFIHASMVNSSVYPFMHACSIQLINPFH